MVSEACNYYAVISSQCKCCGKVVARDCLQGEVEVTKRCAEWYGWLISTLYLGSPEFYFQP